MEGSRDAWKGLPSQPSQMVTRNPARYRILLNAMEPATLDNEPTSREVPPESSDAPPALEPTFGEIVAARTRIASGIERTSCDRSTLLSDLLGMEVYCKREYLQKTGSFKERGARNALLLLPEAARAKGVIAASAGNHALALAFHGRDLGIPVTVVMPTAAPLVKQERCRQFGARVILAGANIAEAKEEAERIIDAEGQSYVHGFDDRNVIAGAGTVGLELLDAVPDLDAVILPVGGAGLLAGVGLALKTMRPSVRLVGVEPENAPSFLAALEAGEPTRIEMDPTLGDGLAVPIVGPRAFALARTVYDEIVTVTERGIALAILRLLELEMGVVEGAGAAPLAALLEGRVEGLAGKKVALVLCGGNIDPAVLGRVIDHGLVEDGRLVQFRALISDRPGGLAKLTATIAECGASVKQIAHERAFTRSNFAQVEVVCTLETRNRPHAQSVLARLAGVGIPCEIVATEV